jgi:hypothetical protein
MFEIWTDNTKTGCVCFPFYLTFLGEYVYIYVLGDR